MTGLVKWLAGALSGLALLLWGGDPAGSPAGVGKGDPPALENYDIRLDAATEAMVRFREGAGRDKASLVRWRDSFAAAEAALIASVPGAEVDHSTDLGAPEMVGMSATADGFLTGPQRGSRVDSLRRFVLGHADLYGLDDAQVAALEVTADYANPDGNLSYVHLEQRIHGLPVFRGEVKAGFTRRGEIVRTISNLAPGLDYASLPSDPGDPARAVEAASRAIGRTATREDLAVTNAASGVVTFAAGQFAGPTTAEPMYFPLEPGVARLAWRVLLWEAVNAYYVVVDAETGTMLWRKNITESQTQPATYNVYGVSRSLAEDSPAPLSPSNSVPGAPVQGAIIGRTNVTLIGNEAPYAFNNLGWITDNTNGANGLTDGNNVEAGLDRVAPDGVDATVPGVGRVFNFAYNPAPGNPAPGDEPLGSPAFQNGIVTNLFYLTNVYHDLLYTYGFHEAALNFQNDNFGRGGAGADRVRAEAQDSSGTNNANFSTPADGGRGRMQMYLFTGPTPDRDGSIDADVVFHELTHGTSNRLHGNATGLTSNMSRGMGEGWSDFYARALLSSAAENVNAVYPTGGYVTYQLTGVTPAYVDNYYYGIRRFPRAPRSVTGGPNNRPHDPLTFADIDSNQIDVTDGAYPRGPIGSATADQVHNAGEVWSGALTEVRARIIQRLGFAAGNARVLQLVTDGMKLSPLNPTFLQARDSILAAAQALGGSDTGDVWAGFATRGMGFSAQVLAAGSPARVVEAFDLPNLQQSPTLSLSDALCNNNGVPDPGEPVVLTVPVTNPLSTPATGVTVALNGGSPVSYGTIAGSATVSRTFHYTVPAGQACGSSLNLTFDINSSLGPTQQVRSVVVGSPVTSLNEAFDGVAAPALPAGWASVGSGSLPPWVTSTTSSDTAPNNAFSPDPATVGLNELTTPSFLVSSAAAQLTFRNNYDMEASFDGGVLEISIAGGAFTDILAAGGSFVSGGYNGTLSTAFSNPLGGRQAWTNTSGGYINTVVNLPPAANGQNVVLRWRCGTDSSVADVGWRLDGIRVVASYSCAPATCGDLIFRDGFQVNSLVAGMGSGLRPRTRLEDKAHLLAPRRAALRRPAPAPAGP